MKFILTMAIFLMATPTPVVKKYALLDKSMMKPVTYTTHYTTLDKNEGLFPIEKKHLNEFVKVLEIIAADLENPNRLKQARQFKIGCINFNGKLLALDRGDKLDYVISSTCAGFDVKVHLCDFNLTPENNLYFVKTWIKYIKASMPKK